MRHGDAAEGDQRRLRRQTRCVATPACLRWKELGSFPVKFGLFIRTTAGVLRPQELRAVFKHFPKKRPFSTFCLALDFLAHRSLFIRKTNTFFTLRMFPLICDVPLIST